MAEQCDDRNEKNHMKLKSEEISHKLGKGELEIPVDPENKSSSPELISNAQDVSLDTREDRIREQLEEEQHELVDDIVGQDSPDYPTLEFESPEDELRARVIIPQERYPNINFIALLMGQRGKTLQRLEDETNCKIKLRSCGVINEETVVFSPVGGEDHSMYVIIKANSEADLAKGVSKIERIVKDSTESYDGNTEPRQAQLPGLTEINSTLLRSEVVRCPKCSSVNHLQCDDNGGSGEESPLP